MQPTKLSNWWKRPLALMLSLALVVSSLGMVVEPEQVQAASSIEVYVSSGGNDTTGDGTKENPYATLPKAYTAIADGGTGTIYLLDDIILSGEAGQTLNLNLDKRVTITTAPGVEGNVMIKSGVPSSNTNNSFFELNKGELTLRNITLDGNYNNETIKGRLIKTYAGTKLIIEEGAILQNSSSIFPGSAIQVTGIGAVVEMKGGEIRGNKSTVNPGAAVRVDDGRFIMTGGRITDNIGGGLHSINNGQIFLSGESIITGNTVSGQSLNVNLTGNYLLKLDGAFTGEAGITAQNRMNVGNQFGQASAEGLSGLENLNADNSSELFAVYGENNALVWQLPPSIEITEPNGNEVYESKPIFEGATDAGATVTVEIKDQNGTVVDTQTVTVNPNGTWSFVPSVELSDGEYTVEVTATKYGKTSTATKNIKVTAPPATPLATPNNVQVNDDTLTWEPVANAGSYEVRITNSEGNTTTVSVTEGNELDLSTIQPPLAPGEYTITVTAKSNNPAAYTDSQASGAIAYTVPNESSVNKSALQAKVAESSTLEQSKYTAESWEQYRLALQKANEVLDDPTATQEEVDNALEKLTTAQNALVQVKGKGLSSLKPSTGTLNPIFQTDVTNYTMNVGYSSSAINLEAISVEAGANITTTVNGQPGTIGQIPLQVGENIIVITVKDSNGNERHYTLKVYREAYTGGSGSSGGSGNSDSSNSTPANSDTTTTIEVNLEIVGNNPLEKTTVKIERTKHANGEITDLVGFSEDNAKEAVEKAKQIGNNIARIVIPDIKDEVDKVTVELPKQSIQTLRDNGISLEISTDNVHIAIPLSSMDGVNDDFYFRLVPVKKEAERKAIEDRARVEQVVRETLQSNDVHAVARPMIIETNMPSRLVQLTLPLKGMDVPTDQVKLEEFLAQLAVFIEHSDGENKVVFPEVVKMAEGELGLRFTVNKFSTFTVIKFEKPRNGEHEAYIKGFDDGTFGPQKNATRAQIAGMIARILGYEGDQNGDYAPFKDVPTDHYAAGAIAFINERGIMNGFENGSFRPNEYITRAQMATVVANFKQLNVKESVAITFNDTKGHWAQWIIEANRNAGIIKGSPDGSFAPNENLTRAQAVTMINRMFERGPLNGVTTPSFPDVDTTHWAFKDIEEAARFHYYFIDEDGNEQLSN